MKSFELCEDKKSFTVNINAYLKELGLDSANPNLRKNQKALIEKTIFSNELSHLVNLKIMEKIPAAENMKGSYVHAKFTESFSEFLKNAVAADAETMTMSFEITTESIARITIADDGKGFEENAFDRNFTAAEQKNLEVIKDKIQKGTPVSYGEIVGKKNRLRSAKDHFETTNQIGGHCLGMRMVWDKLSAPNAQGKFSFHNQQKGAVWVLETPLQDPRLSAAELPPPTLSKPAPTLSSSNEDVTSMPSWDEKANTALLSAEVSARCTVKKNIGLNGFKIEASSTPSGQASTPITMCTPTSTTPNTATSPATSAAANPSQLGFFALPPSDASTSSSSSSSSTHAPNNDSTEEKNNKRKSPASEIEENKSPKRCKRPSSYTPANK